MKRVCKNPKHTRHIMALQKEITVNNYQTGTTKIRAGKVAKSCLK